MYRNPKLKGQERDFLPKGDADYERLIRSMSYLQSKHQNPIEQELNSQMQVKQRESTAGSPITSLF